MASILKVDTIQDQAGNNIINENANVITIGASGDTITIPSGASMSGFTSTGIDDNATSTAITIDSSQQVGIGTASPSHELDVQGTANTSIQAKTTGNSNVFLELDGSSSQDSLVRLRGSGTEYYHLQRDGSQSNDLRIYSYTDTAGATDILRYSINGDLRFGTNASERMRITSSGNVGIGTSSPQAPLHIVGTSSLSTEFKVGNSSWNASNSNAGLLHQYASSTGYSELQINSVATSPSSAFTVRNSTGVAMNFTNDGASTFNGKLTVNDTIKTQTISNRSALQGINPTPNDGNNFELGAGYLNLFRDDTATVKQILFGKNGSEVGSISTTGSATAYNTSSDYRLKENVVDLTNATERLKQLQPKRFNFISNADTTVDGFLAHEVSSVVPEAITGTHNEVKTWKEYEELPEGVSVGDNKLDENGNTIPEYQGIDQSKLVPLLVKTIQELEARITALEINNP